MSLPGTCLSNKNEEKGHMSSLSPSTHHLCTMTAGCDSHHCHIAGLSTH